MLFFLFFIVLFIYKENYVNEELGFEISFDNLEEKLKNYCIIGFLSSIILLWIM